MLCEAGARVYADQASANHRRCLSAIPPSLDGLRFMGRSRRWTSREAGEALAKLERSGASLAAFARREGLSAERPRGWRAELAQRRLAVDDHVVVMEHARNVAGDAVAIGGVAQRRTDADLLGARSVIRVSSSSRTAAISGQLSTTMMRSAGQLTHLAS
jgi:transposase-like protein